MNKLKLIAFEEKHTDDFYKLILSLTDYFTDYAEVQPRKEEVIEHFVYDLPPGLIKDNKDFLLITQQGKFIGFIDIVYGYPKQDNAMLGWLVLHKDYRNKGLGKVLLREIENIVVNKGYGILALSVITTSEAFKFWERCSFVVTGTLNGPYGEQTNMEKILK